MAPLNMRTAESVNKELGHIGFDYTKRGFVIFVAQRLVLVMDEFHIDGFRRCGQQQISRL